MKNIPKYKQGFSLIELMVTIAILAILVAIAAPGMTSLMRANELRGQLSTLKSSLAYARNEAVSRKQQISVCSRKSDTECESSGAWTGWLVFIDLDGDGVVDSNDCSDSTKDCVLKVEQGLSGQVELTSGGNNYVAYDVDGARATGSEGALDLSVCDASASTNGETFYTLTIGASGSTRSSKGVRSC